MMDMKDDGYGYGYDGYGYDGYFGVSLLMVNAQWQTRENGHERDGKKEKDRGRRGQARAQCVCVGVRQQTVATVDQSR